MRTLNDDCLLCKIAKATKTDSHIVPKFMGKSMLADNGKNRAWVLASAKSHLPPRIVQDIEKESYILCPDCETYFSLLETHVYNRAFRFIRDPKKTGDYNYLTKGPFNYKVPLKVDPKIFHLLIHSIIWRCSISSSELYKIFKLDTGFEEEIKKGLIAYKSLTGTDLHYAATNIKIVLPFSSYAIMTHQRIADPTRGMMGVLPANKPPAYKLALNEYWLVLSNDPNNHDQLAFADVNNNTSTPNKIKIGILQESEFNSLHNNLVQRIAKKSTENAKKIGKVPYLVPEDKLGPANVR